MISAYQVRALLYLMSIGFLLGTAWAASPVSEPGRAVLAPNDGFASVATPALPLGTTGGSDATRQRTLTVGNRAELIAALAYPDPTAKLIYVRGTIDVNVSDDGRPLYCHDYERPDPATGEPYSLPAFLAMYDPQGPLGRRAPYGGPEEARRASAAAQAARVHILVPPNTTLYGLGADARLVGAWLDVRPPLASGSQAMNVIIRNLAFEDTADCFPEWSPDDGATGNWNSRYDSISIRNATHVWIDHNRFVDMKTRDETQPVYFGHRLQVHDGLLDITSESDCVTVSWNQFASHDKTMLIGGSDGAFADRDRLRVTLHHNLFDGVGQRAPRVRFGQVHVYNNLYRATRDTNYHSSWGAGFESRIYAENNYFHMSPSFSAMEAIDGKQGTRMSARGNCWRVQETCVATDLVAAWNAKFDPDLKSDAGWTPSLYGSASRAESTEIARTRVLAESGPGKGDLKGD